jgi:predicted transcriptional regulator
VLACLAVARGPLTPAQVRDELGHDTAYTTVMTTLSRLHDKQVLERSPAGRAYAYSIVGRPQDAPQTMIAHQMHKLLDGQTDRAGVLTRFVDQLDSSDEKLLTRLLERSGATSRGKRSTTQRRKPST